MRIGGWLLVLTLGGLAALWIVRQAEWGGAGGDPPPGTDFVGGQPGLRGADAEVGAARERTRGERRETRRLAQRGSGASGFMRGLVDQWLCLVTGRIVDADGKVIEGAMVGTVDETDDGYSTYADEDGRFSLEATEEVPFRLFVDAPGYVPRILPWEQLGSREHRDVGTIRLARGMSIAGRVVDQAGKPWVCSITLVPDEDPWPAWWRALAAVGGANSLEEKTGAEGEFRFAGLQAGAYRLRVQTPLSPHTVVAVVAPVPTGPGGLTIVVKRAPRPESWEVRFALPPRDQPWGPGDISVSWAGERHGCSEIVEGDRIVGSLTGPGPIHARLELEDRSYKPTLVTGLMPPGGTHQVVFERGASVRGRVEGVPLTRLAGAHVTFVGWLRANGTSVGARPEGAASFGRYSRYAALDGQGRFRVDGLTPGRVHAYLNGGDGVDLVDDALQVEVGTRDVRLLAFAYPQVEVEFRAPDAASFQRIVYEIDSIVSGGSWSTRHGSVTPAKTGLSATINLTFGECAHVIHARTAEGDVLGPVSVRIPEGTTRVVVAFPPMRRLRGKVRTAEGKPVPFASVQLVPRHGSVIHTPVPSKDPAETNEAREAPGAVTSLDGRFELRVPPEGRWRLLATRPGWSMRGEPPLAQMGAGTADLVMVPGRRITGYVRGENTWLDEYVVVAWPDAGGRTVRAMVEESGFFEIKALLEGVYTLAVHPGTAAGLDEGVMYGRALVSTVKAGVRDLDITLQPGLVTRLSVVDGAGHRLYGAEVRIRGRFRDSVIPSWWEDRPFEIRSLRPGRYTFDVTVEGKGRRSLAIEAGKDATLVIR